MSLTITVTFNDSVNGSTTDTFSLNDADGATLLSVLAAANAPGAQGGPRQQQKPVTPMTYDALYHQIANNLWLGLHGRVQNIQMQSAQATAVAAAQANVKVISAAAVAHTTPTAAPVVGG